MKQTKEVLHTQGEWSIATGLIFPGDLCIHSKGETICVMPSQFNIGLEKAQANADLICKAVNNYQKYDGLLAAYQMLFDERPRLIDSNRELTEKAKNLLSVIQDDMNIYEDAGAARQIQDNMAALQTAINNAKNIQP